MKRAQRHLAFLALAGLLAAVACSPLTEPRIPREQEEKPQGPTDNDNTAHLIGVELVWLA